LRASSGGFSIYHTETFKSKGGGRGGGKLKRKRTKSLKSVG